MISFRDQAGALAHCLVYEIDVLALYAGMTIEINAFMLQLASATLTR